MGRLRQPFSRRWTRLIVPWSGTFTILCIHRCALTAPVDSPNTRGTSFGAPSLEWWYSSPRSCSTSVLDCVLSTTLQRKGTSRIIQESKWEIKALATHTCPPLDLNSGLPPLLLKSLLQCMCPMTMGSMLCDSLNDSILCDVIVGLKVCCVVLFVIVYCAFDSSELQI